MHSSRQHRRPRARRAAVFLLISLLFALVCGCTTASNSCAPLSLNDALSERLDQWWSELGFTPVMPCGVGSLHVSEITLDRPAGEPRLTFVVSADRSVFLMSQSRAVRPFTQVPDGARRLEWSVDGTTVVGFESSAAVGPAVLYLRWEVDAVIYEFQASLTRRYPSATLAEISRDNVARTLVTAAES